MVVMVRVIVMGMVLHGDSYGDTDSDGYGHAQ